MLAVPFRQGTIILCELPHFAHWWYNMRMERRTDLDWMGGIELPAYLRRCFRSGGNT